MTGTIMESSLANPGRYAVSGAIAGAASAFIFTIIHDILISDIWFSLAIMLVAGALCGACLSWSYSLVVDAPSLRSWAAYNLLYDAMFVLLGLVSVLLFEPVTTMAAVVTANGPPDELIGQAMPITAVFTLLMAIIISLIYGFNWSRFGVILLTSTVLVLLLGLNVSVIGLVSIPRGSWYLVMEMFALILVLNVMYVIVFVGLERKTMLRALMSGHRSVA
ncbi:MAG: hypothetical protein JSW55_17435 [Chloroflexota bacterium]|nr:MAG: hypothetical protein JSW55_17435 [Chloroflexota bacterium]